MSLTTTGDVGAASALAVDRFPVAGADGTLDYQRTFTLPSGATADEIRRAVVVQHGVAKLFGDPTAYDGDPRSSLDPSPALEATIPSTCGELEDEGLLEALLELLGLSRDDGGGGDRNGLLGLFDDRDDDERRRGGDDADDNRGLLRVGVSGRS